MKEKYCGKKAKFRPTRSEYDEDTSPPPLTPAAATGNAGKESKKPQETTTSTTTINKPIPTIIPSFTIPTQPLQAQANGGSASRPGTMPSIPLPLLILNSLQPQPQSQGSNDKKDNSVSSSSGNGSEKNTNDISNVLKDILEVQKETLDLERQKLDLQKQRLEFDRLVGTQLLTLVPMVGGVLQRLAFTDKQLDTTQEGKNGRKRQGSNDLDILKDSKILRTVLEQGIKKYMMEDEPAEEKSDNEDSGIQNDENSISSEK